MKVRLTITSLVLALFGTAAHATDYQIGQTVYGSIPAGTPCDNDTPAVYYDIPAGLTQGTYRLVATTSDNVWTSVSEYTEGAAEILGVGGVGTLVGSLNHVPAGPVRVTITKGFDGSACNTTTDTPFSFRIIPEDTSTGTLVVRTTAGTYIYVSDDYGVVAYGVANNTGSASFDIKAGKYYVGLQTGNGVIWSGGKPLENASTVKVLANKTSSLTLSVTAAPAITSLTQAGTTITITGTGFGSKRGTLDFGGFFTSSKSATPMWTDTQIIAKLPSNALAGCLRVFSPSGGWSKECKPFDL